MQLLRKIRSAVLGGCTGAPASRMFRHCLLVVVALLMSQTDLKNLPPKKDVQTFSKFELPKLDIDNRETFINFVKNDKKFREKKIRFILLDEIGKSRISEDITFDQIKESLSVL